MKSRLVGLNELNCAFLDVGANLDESVSEKEFDLMLMRITVLLAMPNYTCLRPPGAAGALLINRNTPSHNLRPDNWTSVILGCVEPPVGPSCKELGECEMEDGHCVRTIHAELNVLLAAAKVGIPTTNSNVYSILKPCYQCTKAIIAAGIRRIYYAGAAYNEPRTEKLIEKSGVEFIKLDIGLSYGQ